MYTWILTRQRIVKFCKKTWIAWHADTRLANEIQCCQNVTQWEWQAPCRFSSIGLTIVCTNRPLKKFSPTNTLVLRLQIVLIVVNIYRKLPQLGLWAFFSETWLLYLGRQTMLHIKNLVRPKLEYAAHFGIFKLKLRLLNWKWCRGRLRDRSAGGGKIRVLWGLQGYTLFSLFLLKT